MDNYILYYYVITYIYSGFLIKYHNWYIKFDIELCKFSNDKIDSNSGQCKYNLQSTVKA